MQQNDFETSKVFPKSEHSKQECSCSECVNACRHKPGWFLPHEVITLANEIGLSVQDLFNRHLSADYYYAVDEDGNPDITHVISPSIINEQSGGVLRGFGLGQCTFLKNNKCSIHTLGKPFECAVTKGCGSGMDGDVHEGIAKSWDKPKHQKMVFDLIGQKFGL